MRRLLELFLHRLVLAPIAPATLSEGTACCHCGAPASEVWWPGFCSLSGEPKCWMPVCAACDVEQNETGVRFLFGNTKDHLLKAYREHRMPTPATEDEANG